MRLPSIPLIGKYDSEYRVALPFIVVKLPGSANKALPVSLADALAAAAGGFAK